MRMFHVLYGKKSVPLLIFLMLVFSLLSLLNVNVKVVSAVTSPYIIMEPAFTDNKTLGENLNITIKTDYTGTDIFSWGFTLTYNPLVLHGVTVTNGDLITKDKNSTATFIPGTFDNTEGKLGTTTAGFFGDTDPTDGIDVTYGPGTLANITFTVVGYGKTNMTFGRGPVETYLQGFDATPSPGHPDGQSYIIIDAKSDPDHIQDSSLINVQNLHTVGVPHIAAPSEAVIEHVVDINVTVVNGGNDTENGNVALYNGTNEIGNEPFTTLESGEFETFSFSWNTSGLNEGFYTLNATATIPGDEFPSDNNKTALIELKKIHDVAVLNVSAPTQADMGEPVAINVTITNNGSFDESVNVTLIAGEWNENAHELWNPTVIGSQFKNVLIRGSALVQFSWDASGLNPMPTYTLNATATIPGDEFPSDNRNNATIKLVKGHDVTVIEIEAASSLFVGQSASINVTVRNNGLYAEDSVNVTLSYKSVLINTTLIDFQVRNISKWGSILVQFSWNTSGFAPDKYYLNATATISGDGNPVDNTGIEIIIVKGALITGVVTDALTGNPIEAASIIAGDYSATTDINGTYNIKNVLPGTYNVTASATGYETASQLGITVITEPEPTTVNFELIPLPGAITGTVTNALTGKAIVGATLTANGYNATTDAYGHYNITDVPLGTYLVTASATGYESASQTNITVFPGKTATVNFTLREISTITISADPANITVGENITINASLSPIRIDVNITILYRLNGEEVWTKLANVTANASGQFVYVWKPETTGTYEIKAEWLGDEKTSPAENSVQVKVEAVPSDIFLYLAIGAAVAGVSGLAIAVYLLKIRKPT